VSIHQRRATENLLHNPIKSLIPFAEIMPSVFCARLAVGNPFGNDGEHAAEKIRLAALKFAKRIAVLKAGPLANPANAGAVG
jgi:hypothetical protein